MALENRRYTPVERGQRAVVVGAGKSGRAAVRLLLRQGAVVRLLEKNANAIPADFRAEAETAGVQILLGEHSHGHFAGAHVVVPSPGIPVARLTPLLAPQREGGPEIIAEMELAWRHLQDEPVLAITGTSGKTTTASLAAAMLQAQGLTVFLGGNIGTPLCEYVLSSRQADVLVVEVSSFQLQTCRNFCPRVGVLLNISENHLDYHADMREYTNAKFRIFRCQDENDIAVLHTSLRELAHIYGLSARTVWFEGSTGRFARHQLFGAHNEANMEAAWLACREFGVSPEAAARAVAAFKPLPSRLERVAEHGGVLYVNDSKCTTVSALAVALRAFTRPIVLLCGGKFKGGDLGTLLPLITERVKAVCLFGASREHFEAAWQGMVSLTWDENLRLAVERARSLAQSGDVILLAPATASFDAYTNYEERGQDFKNIVNSLIRTGFPLSRE